MTEIWNLIVEKREIVTLFFAAGGFYFSWKNHKTSNWHAEFERRRKVQDDLCRVLKRNEAPAYWGLSWYWREGLTLRDIFQSALLVCHGKAHEERYRFATNTVARVLKDAGIKPPKTWLGSMYLTFRYRDPDLRLGLTFLEEYMEEVKKDFEKLTHSAKSHGQ